MTAITLDVKQPVTLSPGGAGVSAPAFSSISVPASVGRYAKHESTFSLTTVATNSELPYDASAPSGIDGMAGVTVNAEYSRDGFATWVVVPCFYEQVYQRLTNADTGTIQAGRDWLYPTATVRWVARFSPSETGSWSVRFRATDSGGTTLSDASAFTATAAAVGAHGIIRRAAVDSRYFEHADGTFFWPIGWNASEVGGNPSDTSSIDMDDGQLGNTTPMSVFGANGVNTIRLFLKSWSIQGDTSPPWLSGNARPQIASLARDGVTADAGSGSEFAWRLDNRTYTLTRAGTGTGGTFTISVTANGETRTTAPIAYNASQQGVQGALTALSNVTQVLGEMSGANLATDGTVYSFMPEAVAGLPTEITIDTTNLVGGVLTLGEAGEAIGSNYVFSGWLKRSPACKPSTVYKVTLRYRLDGDLVAADINPHGLTVKMEPFFRSTSPALSGLETAGAKYLTDAVSGAGGNAVRATSDSGGWASLVGYYRTGASERWLCNTGYVYIALENCATSSGGQACWIDRILIEETDGAGNVTGPQVNAFSDADAHSRVDRMRAKAFDLALERAEANGVTFKLVLGGDNLISAFTDANEVGASTTGNFYGPVSQAITRGRWWHRAWWRYAQARWGYSSAVHSWELMNEGDPLNGRHASLARLFGDYLGQKAAQFGNSHLTTTSYNGIGSWPRYYLEMAGVTDPSGGIDYGDTHIYLRNPDNFTGNLTARSDPDQETVTAYTYATDDPASEWRDYPAHLIRVGAIIGANGTQGLDVPVMLGEVGLYDDSTDTASADLASDTNRIWLHKLLWGQLAPGGLMSAGWWYDRQHIYDRSDGNPNNVAEFKPFAEFISSLDLNDGGYVDAAATGPDPELRVTGQKQTTTGKAHLWIDHTSHRWTDVVDGVTPTPHGGTVTVGGMPVGRYSVSCYDPYTRGPALPSTVSTDLAVTAVRTGDIPAQTPRRRRGRLALFGRSPVLAR